MNFIQIMKIMNHLENQSKNSLTSTPIIWQKLPRIIIYQNSDVLLLIFTVKMVNLSKVSIFPRKIRSTEMLLKLPNRQIMLKLLNNCLNSLSRKRKNNTSLLLFTLAMIILGLILHQNMLGASICMSSSCHSLFKWYLNKEPVKMRYIFYYLD